jgi:hypothetical protein
MADSTHDPPPHAGHVVRRVLLRRGTAIDPETARLVADAVQAALRADTPARPPLRARVFLPSAASRCFDAALASAGSDQVRVIAPSGLVNGRVARD